MAKKDVSKSITKVNPTAIVAPTFMEGETIGIKSLEEFIVPPFIKVVQKQASDELLSHFGIGDVILSPANALIAEMPRNQKGRPIDGARCFFQIVPLLFYPEWVTWNPIELKGTEPAIQYRTTDPTDPIVTKCRSQVLRKEPHPTRPDLKIRHVEHLNFLVVLYKHALSGEAAVLSFSRGEWKAGSKFANLIKMRKASIFGCVFDAVLGHRSNDKGDWYGLDMCNPDEGIPWVKEEEYEFFKELHIKFDKLHKKSLIKTAYDSEESSDPAAVPATENF